MLIPEIRSQSMRNFDPVFYVTISKGSVFYGSSVDDSVHCLDLNSGSEKWVAFTSGAVRLPPSLDKGKCFLDQMMDLHIVLIF